MNVSLTVLSVIVGGCLTTVGALIVFNLRSIKKCITALGQRITKQEDNVTQITRDMTACKIDCDRQNVSKEDWVRSDAFTRDKLDKVAGTLSRMEGKLQVVDKLPEICGNIAREIAAQMKPKG